MDALDYLEKRNVKFKKIHLDEIPRTAKDVERIYGCQLHQVLKTLLFIGRKPVITVLLGDKKVDIEKLKKIVKDDTLRLATPNEVKEITGYTIGGVSPFCIENNVFKILDESVLEIDVVNIGSGKAEIGIEITSSELKKAWDGVVRELSSFQKK